MPLRVTTSMVGLGGGPFYSQMHFAGETQGAADAAADAVWDFWQAIFTSQAAGLTLTVEPEVIQFDLSTGAPETVYATSEAPMTSSGGGDALPWGTQGLIRWRTGAFLGGRELRGRTFIPALTEGHNTAGRPAAALITILNNAAAALIADGASELMVYSPTKSAIATVVTGTGWSEWAQLRSRRD